MTESSSVGSETHPVVAMPGVSGQPLRDATEGLDWAADGSQWPLAEHSLFPRAGGLRWHVQIMGSGPTLLLVHGTGSSTHSWASLAPILAQHFKVVMLDLPGHAFTQRRTGADLSLPQMARGVAELMRALTLEPAIVVGHSAGVAILIRCCLDGRLNPNALVSINGALLPFGGAASWLFPSLAKLLFLNPLMPRLFARSARDRHRVERLIEGTGSNPDRIDIERYRHLFSDASHVAATLGMMAHWDLHPFLHQLPQLTVPTLFIVSDNDRAIPPEQAERMHARIPKATLARLPDLGHLAHEEDAPLIGQTIVDYLQALRAWPATAVGGAR
ncbi:MAG: alpha/beta fold hydrolase BchO [Pseudomonadota bacterium]